MFQHSGVADRFYNLITTNSKATVSAISEAIRDSAPTFNKERNALKMYMFILHWFFTVAKTAQPSAPKATAKRVRSFWQCTSVFYVKLRRRVMYKKIIIL